MNRKEYVEVETQKKRKSRFGVVLGVVIVSLGISFSYLTIAQKDKYTVLDNSSKEVKSRIIKIKDLRTLKGYKVIEESGEHKLVLLSAGLTYDSQGSIEVSNVEFGKGTAKIIVKEVIDKNPENQKVTYPYIIVKLNSDIDNIVVVNESGEKYEEIFLNKHTNEEVVNKDDDKDELVEEEQDENKEDEEEQEELEDQEEEQEDVKEQTISLTCTYEGKADATTIEISVNGQYKTFDISNVSKKFDNMEVGKQITIDYIETEGNGKIINVR